MLLTSVPFGAVRAGMVPTEDVIGAAQAEANRETVNEFLAREEVREQFRALGVDPAEASRRVAALSDEELRMIAGRINAAPAGGNDVESAADLATLVLLIVLIVLFAIGYLIYIVVGAVIESAESEASDSDEPDKTLDVPGF